MTPALLLPLTGYAATDPAAWRAVAGHAATEEADAAGTTVVVDDPALVPDDPAGPVLGRVDVRFATRPVADLLDDVARWRGSGAAGVFLDQAPTSPFSLGPVALAVRLARRTGLSSVVLNPGVPTDLLYRELDLRICTFEGSWADYQRWSGDGARPGDGHLVHSVPPAAVPLARSLLRQRRAGFGLVTDGTPPDPYAGLPGWLAPAGVTTAPLATSPAGG